MALRVRMMIQVVGQSRIQRYIPETDFENFQKSENAKHDWKPQETFILRSTQQNTVKRASQFGFYAVSNSDRVHYCHVEQSSANDTETIKHQLLTRFSSASDVSLIGYIYSTTEAASSADEEPSVDVDDDEEEEEESPVVEEDKVDPSTFSSNLKLSQQSTLFNHLIALKEDSENEEALKALEHLTTDPIQCDYLLEMQLVEKFFEHVSSRAKPKIETPREKMIVLRYLAIVNNLAFVDSLKKLFCLKSYVEIIW
eukprot:CAMPEP_0117421118 /NCGR_PEP_ID=MMETSP0758-20121206/2293_1 /TAXON_ID=63605 /ORGANISM="Percolomonas cosmopolitus, Strain AE-1 (ATCC 50343)" /LENGTH=254 /DNA_ID=CAMNT_0005203089 /DNA_START=110 /DNA_END=871 /DNA_ORIENTATION=+